MKLRNIVIAVSLATLSTPLLARTPECTNLDKAHWIHASEMQSKLTERGYQVIALEVIDTCYKARLKTKKGNHVDGFYDPVGGHPIRRKVI